MSRSTPSNDCTPAESVSRIGSSSTSMPCCLKNPPSTPIYATAVPISQPAYAKRNFFVPSAPKTDEVPSINVSTAKKFVNRRRIKSGELVMRHHSPQQSERQGPASETARVCAVAVKTANCYCQIGDCAVTNFLSRRKIYEISTHDDSSKQFGRIDPILLRCFRNEIAAPERLSVGEIHLGVR